MWGWPLPIKPISTQTQGTGSEEGRDADPGSVPDPSSLTAVAPVRQVQPAPPPPITVVPWEGYDDTQPPMMIPSHPWE